MGVSNVVSNVYTFDNISRGGVAIYVNKDLNYRVVENISCAGDLFKCITIEICGQNKKNMYM